MCDQNVCSVEEFVCDIGISIQLQQGMVVWEHIAWIWGGSVSIQL